MAGRHNVCDHPAHNPLNHTLGYNLLALDGAGCGALWSQERAFNPTLIFAVVTINTP